MAGRLRANLSQSEASRRTGIDAATISRLEGGGIAEPKFTDIAILADLYGIDLVDLTVEAGLPYRRGAANDEAWLDTIGDARLKTVVQMLLEMEDPGERGHFVSSMYHMLLNKKVREGSQSNIELSEDEEQALAFMYDNNPDFDSR